MTRWHSGAGSIGSSYSAIICDLDGVVYRGSRAVPGAIEALGSLLGSGRGITFATNNASREPRVVESHLRSLGMETGAWSVVTSESQAAAACVVDRIGTSHPVLAVGGPGVAQALREAGLRPITAASGPRNGQAAAVVQGAGTNVNWRDLAEASHQGRGRRAVGRDEPGQDHPDRPGPRARQRRSGGRGPGRRRRRPRRRGKAGAVALPAGAAPSRRVDRRRSCRRGPPRHRHRGRQRGRHGLAPRPQRRGRDP